MKMMMLSCEKTKMMLKKSNKNSEKQDENLACTLKKHKKIIMQTKNNKNKDNEATLYKCIKQVP
jgi:hypothetical protein